jgi:hypothetical protein
MAQGIIFAVSQSFGLQGLLILGCEPISQIMLPGEILASVDEVAIY